MHSPLLGWLGWHLQGPAGHLPQAGTLASEELSITVPVNLQSKGPEPVSQTNTNNTEVYSSRMHKI